MTNAQVNQWINTFYRHGAIGVELRDEFKMRLNVALEDFETVISDLEQFARFLPSISAARWRKFCEGN